MKLQKYQNHFFILPVVLVALSLLTVFMWGLKPNVELAGGSLLQVHYETERPSIGEVESRVAALDIGEVMVQPTGDSDYILRQRVLSPEEKTGLLEALTAFGPLEETRYTSIGPSIGSELVRKAWWAITLVILSTIIYIAIAFRGVGGSAESGNVPSWKYGLVAIVTLAHDVIIPIGLYAYLGHAYGSEVGTLFIVALLTILGISINDTIVIFDRIRENLKLNEEKRVREPFGDVVWRSLSQTITRSVNTSVTVLFMLFALAFLGPESTKELAITLTVGMVAGTYSSILLAAPMLVVIEKYQKHKPIKS